MALKMSFMIDGKQVPIADVLFPIGFVYISTNNVNPSTFLGGTWERFGNGRTLVGVSESETEFNTVQKTGGSKYMQKHSHKVSTVNNYSSGSKLTLANANYFILGFRDMVTSESGTGDSGNLQPYITVYFWRRTA